MSWTRNIYEQMNRPVGPTTVRRLVTAFALFLVPVIVFSFIAHEVSEGDTTPIDDKILLSIYHRSTPLLNEIILFATNLGGVLFIAGATMIASGYYMLRHKWQAVTQILAGVGGAGLLNFTLKLLFERDRPDLWHHLVFESSYSFPSGHAMLSSAFALSMVAILWHTKWRWLVFVLATVYIFTIGFTRLYLGVHFPTDVIAGWCVSLAWVFTVATILGSLKWHGYRTAKKPA